MAGGGAAARAGEHVAEGIIAKAAKDVLRDAIGPGAAHAAEDAGRTAGKDVLRDTVAPGATHVAEDAAERAGTDAAAHIPAAGLTDAERTAARDALNDAKHAGTATPEDFAREFPELAHGTNPHYGTGLPEYRENCQSCVVAVDKSLEGEPTEAAARALNQDRSAFLPDSRFEWPSSVESQVGRGNAVHPVGGYDEIAHEMLQGGDGARGVVHGMRLNPDGSYSSGHVFNVVNKGGTLHFLDGQENGYWRRELFQGYQFIRTK